MKEVFSDTRTRMQKAKSLQRRSHLAVRQRNALRELCDRRGLIEQSEKFSLSNRKPGGSEFFFVKCERRGAPQSYGIECRHACREVLLFESTSLQIRTTYVMPKMLRG